VARAVAAWSSGIVDRPTIVTGTKKAKMPIRL
jgi:hypothetical protein